MYVCVGGRGGGGAVYRGKQCMEGELCMGEKLCIEESHVWGKQCIEWSHVWGKLCMGGELYVWESHAWESETHGGGLVNKATQSATVCRETYLMLPH